MFLPNSFDRRQPRRIPYVQAQNEALVHLQDIFQLRRLSDLGCRRLTAPRCTFVCASWSTYCSRNEGNDKRTRLVLGTIVRTIPMYVDRSRDRKMHAYPKGSHTVHSIKDPGFKNYTWYGVWNQNPLKERWDPSGYKPPKLEEGICEVGGGWIDAEPIQRNLGRPQAAWAPPLQVSPPTM